jgi:Family of unknown function (DUF6510)
MTDLYLDGNGVAGLLADIFGADVTAAARTCMSCGRRHELAAHRAYHGAGVVLRCPTCDDAGLRVGTLPDRFVVELRGSLLIEVPVER